MLSKLVSRYNSKATLVNMAQRGFRASAIAHKKPSIGDAVTILQSKVSSINQVVSTTSTILLIFAQLVASTHRWSTASLSYLFNCNG